MVGGFEGEFIGTWKRGCDYWYCGSDVEDA